MGKIQRAVVVVREANLAAEEGCRAYLETRSDDELVDLIELGGQPDSVVTELVLWQAQKIMHDRTGRWIQ